MTSLGLTGERRDLLTTRQVAARLGYPSMAAWYADAAKRRASHFPRPLRRGLYQLGRLQDWLDAGGFDQGASPAAQPPQGRPAARSEASEAERERGCDGPHGRRTDHAPRPEVVRRLRAIAGGR